MTRYATPPPAPLAHVALPGPRNRDALRAELQAQVDAYLAAGGAIDRAPTPEPVPRRPHKGPAESAQRVRKPWSPAEVDMVRAMRAESHSLRQIAEAVTQAFGYPRSRPAVESLCNVRSIRLGREPSPDAKRRQVAISNEVFNRPAGVRGRSRAGNRGRIKPRQDFFEDDV